jgi:LysM repeat protein
MKDIKEYRSRFYNLLESTIGDVKPLISEQGEYPKPTPTPNPAFYPKPTPTPNPAFSNNPNPNSGNNSVPSGVGQGGNNSVNNSKGTNTNPASPSVNNSVQGVPNPVTPNLYQRPEPNNPDITKSGDGYLGTALSVHKVAAGENLTNIAKTYGVTVDQILKSNPQIKNKNIIKAGEIINIER